jgi:hypothetical protein
VFNTIQAAWPLTRVRVSYHPYNGCMRRPAVRDMSVVDVKMKASVGDW